MATEMVWTPHWNERWSLAEDDLLMDGRREEEDGNNLGRTK